MVPVVPVAPAIEVAPSPLENAADALRRTFMVEAATAQEADRRRMPNRRKPQLSKSGACGCVVGWFIVVRAVLSFHDLRLVWMLSTGRVVYL